MQGRVAQLQALIGIEQQAFVQRFQIRPEQIEAPVAYERMKELSVVSAPEHPDLGAARFYFQNAKLVLIYLSGNAGIPDADLEAATGGAGHESAVLRSRAGKTSNQRVYADRGIAVSKGKKLDFIEIFQPTTPQTYEQTIYVAPGPFPL
jgi:hypothetical protein